MTSWLSLLGLLLAICESFGQQPSLAFNQDEPSTSKHRHAVEHLEPDPAKTIFNAVPKNPLQRTTASPRVAGRNKMHAGSVQFRRGKRSTNQKENLDREYDVLVSDFSEDENSENVPVDLAVEKPADSTMEPKWTTRVVGSAEVLDPRAVEAPIHQHRVAVPAHLVERVRESLETEETEFFHPTTLSATQRALNLFMPITKSTQKSTMNMDVAVDEASGQEPPATNGLVDKDLLRSVIADKLNKLFVTQDLEQSKLAKTIVPNKQKGPPKTTTVPATIRHKSETMKTVEMTKRSATGSPSTLKTNPSTSTTNTPKPTSKATTQKRTTSTKIQSTTQQIATTTESSTTVEMADETTNSIKIPIADIKVGDEFVEEHQQEAQVSRKLLDGTVIKPRRLLSNFVQNQLQKGVGLIRRKRQTENSSTEIQPTTTTPLSTTQRNAIQAQDLRLSTITILFKNETTEEAVTQSTPTTRKSRPALRKALIDSEFRDIALSETALGVSEQKQGLTKGTVEQASDKNSFNLEAPQHTSTVPSTQQPIVQIPQNWAPQPQPLPQQQTGFQPILNHFVVGNRRFVIPSITYEQHIAQQNGFWPQQQFVAPLPAQPIPQPQFVPQIQPQIPVQRFNQPPALQPTSQRPVLQTTTQAQPLVRTTEPSLPDIIHTTTPPAKTHVRGVYSEKSVDFDLYDEVEPINRQ